MSRIKVRGDEMSDISVKFGRRVRHYRTEAGLSQEKLAEYCGLHPTYIGQIERGEKNCTLESAERIAEGLKIPLESLISKLVPREKTAADEIYETAVLLSERSQKQLLDIIKKIIEFD